MNEKQANVIIVLLVVLIGAVVNNTRIVGKPSLSAIEGNYATMSDGRRAWFNGSIYKWEEVDGHSIPGSR